MEPTGYGKAQQRFTGLTVIVLKDIEAKGGRAFAYKVIGNGYGAVTGLKIQFDDSRRICMPGLAFDTDDGLNPRPIVLKPEVCDRYLINKPRLDPNLSDSLRETRAAAIAHYERTVADLLSGVTYLEGEEPKAAPAKQQKPVPAESRV